MGFFEGARGRLHYRDRPVEGAVAVLALLPGSGQHSGHYHEFARRLNAAGIAMCALDTAGQGLSEGSVDRPARLPDLVDDAVRFVAEVRTGVPDLPLTLMGHSLGAVTALAALGAARPVPAAAGGRSAPKSTEYPVDAVLDERDLAGLVLCGTPARVLGGTPAAGPRLPRTLLVHGADDRRAPIEPVRAWASRHAVHLREYADAGHDLLHERVRGRVTADIVAWTQEIVAGPARRG
ncbi:alpha/beta hydrolase [Nocardia carnea]|uniref:alpha/beta hydrolase n=1 Tax=Nocardia carnea TaxID=37328 RepID=UPI002458FCB9|nr:alpha/beta fold hydrolase [Nocardia carnea]